MRPLPSSAIWLAMACLTVACLSHSPAWSQSSSGQSSSKRGFTDSTPPATTSSSTAYLALVIGNDNYRYLPKLKTASADANEIARVLHERYGFTTNVLLDGTRNRILTALNEYRRNLPPDSNLLIYYAGHGHHDPETDKAYWLPVDAQADNNENWISADDITSDVKAIPSQHVLIISDSCYSGALTRGVDVGIRPRERHLFLAKVGKLKSRDLMSSGGDEPVLDSGGAGHSIFADVILNSLGQMDEDRFTASELFYRFVQAGVAGRSPQVPHYSLIQNSGDQLGDFVFLRAGAVEKIADSLPGGTTGIGTGGAGPARASVPKRLDPRDLTSARRQFDSGDFAGALPVFRQAANSGDADAMSYLGNYYQKGDLVAKSDAEALQWFRKSAEAGSRRGMFWLGFSYRRGRGIDKDTKQALTWYHKAADLGDPTAMAGLGNMYESGDGVPKDLGQAQDWYRKSAAHDDPTGMYLLGKTYQSGTGVSKSDATAFTWFHKAADGGFTAAMNDLGLDYMQGLGVEKNPAQAAAWFKKSSDLGDARGMGLLGMAYEFGQGVEKNLATAESWYTKAAGRDDQWAADQLKRIDNANAEANASSQLPAAAKQNLAGAGQSAFTPAQNGSAVPATGASFAVMHYGGTEFTQNCMGWMTVEPGVIHYRAVQGTDGMHSYDFPAQTIKEVKKNALVGIAMQAFHVRLTSGEVYNFSVFDPNTRTYLNADTLLLAIHQGLGK